MGTGRGVTDLAGRLGGGANVDRLPGLSAFCCLFILDLEKVCEKDRRQRLGGPLLEPASEWKIRVSLLQALLYPPPPSRETASPGGELPKVFELVSSPWPVFCAVGAMMSKVLCVPPGIPAWLEGCLITRPGWTGI